MPDELGAEFIRLQQALAGRYSLERELGRGGMGIVYLAREVRLDRPVALKILPPHLAEQPAARERFLHEARTAAKLSHPNIVPIFAVDEVDDIVFFAMAYIEGETLGQRVRARGPRPPVEAARILRELAWALAYAHAQGVIHRDVKPDNILLESGSGRALVADFGIARAAESAEAGARQVSGTAEFMSPEQARGASVGPASDTYSLGAVGFYVLSGRFPFEGSTPHAILAGHIADPAPAVKSVAPGVPSKLAQAIDRCLAKDPAHRFTSDEELVEVLGQVVEERREVPVPLRVFVKRGTGIGAGGAFVYIWVLAALSGMIGGIVPFGLGAFVSVGTFIAGVTLVPAAIVIRRVRRLIKNGFGHEELGVAFRAEIERRREEGVFEFGHGPSLYERVVRLLSVVGLGAAAVSAVALGATPGAGPQWLWMVFGFSFGTGGVAGILALLRLQRRRDIDRELRGWLWRSRLGRWIFRVAGSGLTRLPRGGSPTYRPTEMAIGMAADRLYEELPRELRRSLGDLPEVVRRLEADAGKMRRRVEELSALLPQIGGARPESRALAAALRPEAGGDVDERRRTLEDGLRATRDATQQRLADAVAALEAIRLSLLRLQAGSGSVESLTGDLAAARDVTDGIDRLLEAQREVESLLKNTES
jgi:serine/threonine-protein kinase